MTIARMHRPPGLPPARQAKPDLLDRARALQQRRRFLQRALATDALPFDPLATSRFRRRPGSARDAGLVNLLLNFEYLEAGYFHRGLATGMRSKAFLPTDGLLDYVGEIAGNEAVHVAALAEALADVGVTAIDRPAVEYRSSLAHLVGPRVRREFDPFGSEADFALGAVAVERLATIAHALILPSIRDPRLRRVVAEIKAVEDFHDAEWTLLAASPDGSNLVRAVHDGLSRLVPAGSNPANPGPVDPEAISRLIAFGSRARSSGGFFPGGLNGPAE